MIEIPSDLHPDLVPLAFLLGNWAGAGVSDFPGAEKCNFGQEVTFSRTRSDQSLRASRAAFSGVSSWVTPTSTHRPSPTISPTTPGADGSSVPPATETPAPSTRCTTARIQTNLLLRAERVQDVSGGTGMGGTMHDVGVPTHRSRGTEQHEYLWSRTFSRRRTGGRIVPGTLRSPVQRSLPDSFPHGRRRTRRGQQRWWRQATGVAPRTPQETWTEPFYVMHRAADGEVDGLMIYGTDDKWATATSRRTPPPYGT
ncbi:hypothetical protein SCALM49S_02902 [Streptomyces californicus]